MRPNNQLAYTKRLKKPDCERYYEYRRPNFNDCLSSPVGTQWFVLEAGKDTSIYEATLEMWILMSTEHQFARWKKIHFSIDDDLGADRIIVTNCSGSDEHYLDPQTVQVHIVMVGGGGASGSFLNENKKSGVTYGGGAGALVEMRFKVPEEYRQAPLMFEVGNGGEIGEGRANSKGGDGQLTQFIFGSMVAQAGGGLGAHAGLSEGKRKKTQGGKPNFHIPDLSWEIPNGVVYKGWQGRDGIDEHAGLSTRHEGGDGGQGVYCHKQDLFINGEEGQIGLITITEYLE